MELQLASVRARKILLEEKAVESPIVEFRFRIGYPQDPDTFSIEFDFKLENEEENYCLQTVYEATFSTNKDIDDEFKNSGFPRINAPAIAFPYFRAYISTITQQAGYSSVVLPSVNFTKMEMEEESVE